MVVFEQIATSPSSMAELKRKNTGLARSRRLAEGQSVRSTWDCGIVQRGNATGSAGDIHANIGTNAEADRIYH
jgi:hypothetical protein